MKKALLFLVLCFGFINIINAEKDYTDYYEIQIGDILTKDNLIRGEFWGTASGDNIIVLQNKEGKYIYWVTVPLNIDVKRYLGDYYNSDMDTEFTIGERCEELLLNNYPQFGEVSEYTDKNGKLTKSGAKKFCEDKHYTTYDSGEDFSKYTAWQALTNRSELYSAISDNYTSYAFLNYFCSTSNGFCDDLDTSHIYQWTPIMVFKAYDPSEFNIVCDQTNLKNGEKANCTLDFNSEIALTNIIVDLSSLPFKVSNVTGINGWNISIDNNVVTASNIISKTENEVLKFDITAKEDTNIGKNELILNNISYKTIDNAEVTYSEQVKTEIEYKEEKIEEKEISVENNEQESTDLNEEKNPFTKDSLVIVVFISLLCLVVIIYFKNKKNSLE